LEESVLKALSANTSPVIAVDGSQSVLSPAGLQASSIQHLWSLMLWISVAVMAVVLTYVILAVRRGMRNRSDERPSMTSERALSRGVGIAVGTTVILLVGLLVASVWTGRVVGSLHASSAVTVEIIGHQWWWEIQYDDAVASRRVLTANEFHIPINRPVVLKVTSRDVIHSFWVPNLQGKRDLIPGYTTALWIQADRPGVFRGQCAEFCGLQHAHMALDVVVESDGEFEAWLEAMREPAPDPPDGAPRKGRDVFMQARCAGCHTIRGTDAAGQVAPDLTHLATRSTLGAGTVANTPDDLAAWILDPQSMKPGNQMPPNPLSSDDVKALVAYLETLR
jgi:cytochrome c oxidase subunit 2